MKIQHRLTQEANAAAARYDNVVYALRAIYLSALGRQGLGSAQLLAEVRNSAYAVTGAYINGEEKIIESVLDEIVSEAQGSVEEAFSYARAEEESGAISELYNATNDYLLQEITIQTVRDVATLVEEVRRAGLSVELQRRATGSVTPGLVERALPNFHFRDRRHFKVASRTFIRGVWRMSMLSLYNETVLLTLADHGHDLAQIDHLDAKAPVHGSILAIAPGGETPSYEEIRAEVFHPNSDAVIVPLGAADVSP